MTHKVGPKQRKGNDKEKFKRNIRVLLPRKVRLRNRSEDNREKDWKDSSGES